MPYIKTDKRNKITPVVHGPNTRVESQFIDCSGDLNYAFTILAIDYIKRKGLNYQNINDVSGAFTEAQAEFRRRVTADYEQNKIEESGDVYPDLRTPIYPNLKDFNGS
jgi:hypothetical protein